MERFDYSRVGQEWPVLRLVGALVDRLGAPAQATLMVTRGQARAAFPARTCALERRMGAHGGPAIASELLWRASFVVPLEVVEFEQTLFGLIAAGRVQFALASPQLRTAMPQALRAAGPRTRPHGRGRSRGGRPPVGQMRRRIFALATAVAVTASSSPAVSLAATGFTRSALAGTPAGGDGAGATLRPGHAAPPSRLRTRASVERDPTTTAIPTPTPPPTPAANPTPTAPRSASPPGPTPANHLVTTAPAPHPNRPVTAIPSRPPPNQALTGTGPHGASRSPRPAASRDSSRAAPISGVTPRPPVKPDPASPSDDSPAPTSSTPQTAQLLSDSPAGFSAPSSWTGSVSTDPSLAGALNNLSALLADGDRPPAFLIPIYMEAGRRYGVPWQVLASINAIESDYGRNLSTSTAGALGWMQFEPSTWREYGKAVDGHSVANPYDPRDAIFAAAHYLAVAGAAQNISRAVFAYNHAGWYVEEVLRRAQRIAADVHPGRMKIKQGVVSVYFTNPWRRRRPDVYRGGIMSHYDRLIASANMVSAASFPYLYGGGHEQPARFGPFDCSGSVSYIVQQAGYRVPTTVSGDIPTWNFPAGPGRVTIFYNPTHTFMRLGDRYFGTSGFARAGGGAGWFDTATLPASYLSAFRQVHIPRLGVNSFAPVKKPAGPADPG